MPIPSPKEDEDNQKFVGRCMGDETMKKDYPDSKQRVAICLGQTKQKNKSSIFDQVFNILNYSLSYDSCDSCGSVEELSLSNLVFPTEYETTDEITEEYDVSYLYNTPTSVASEYQGRKVTLNKPFRTPGGPKKFAVYVKNNKGKVVIVRFGDPNLSIKRDDPKRRKSFRARHKCDQQKDKTTPAYWSCYQWRSNSPVQD
jgi:hypothetical protein